MSRYSKPYKFHPRNTKKYVGNIDEIWVRSSWELKTMVFFDNNPSIVKWSSEETIVPYIDKVSGRQRRYFVDFTVQYKTRSGEIKKSLVEVKPKAQTLPPKKPSRMTKKYMTEVTTYITNTSKWEHAQDWVKTHGFDSFIILTEDDLKL